jgi:3'(2'), 5'-bisphosphate nucleotidase
MITIPLHDELISSVQSIAVEAGSAIMDVYHTDYDIHIKKDNSPVTEADKKANAIISSKMKKLTPDPPILCEEGRN